MTSNAAIPRKASICENRLALFIKYFNPGIECPKLNANRTTDSIPTFLLAEANFSRMFKHLDLQGSQYYPCCF
jgi:hypothetical protein